MAAVRLLEDNPEEVLTGSWEQSMASVSDKITLTCSGMPPTEAAMSNKVAAIKANWATGRGK